MADYLPQLDSIERKSGAKLPHWTCKGAIYHSVFRLADSLPASALREIKEEILELEKRSRLALEDRDRRADLRSARIEKYLDAGAGSCLMALPAAAEIVWNALQFFDGKKYLLHAKCVMPNHVHLVVEPLEAFELAEVMHSIKSFTSSEFGKKLGQKGKVWAAESYDHIIRTEAELQATIEYVRMNPIKANLRDWKWVHP